MSKYPRQQGGLFGLDSTAFLWAIIGAALLAGGFFLFGMYYGYQQGYQAAKQSLSDDEPARRVSVPSDSPPASSGSPADNSDRSGRSSAITADQLSGTETDRGRAGVYDTAPPTRPESVNTADTPASQRTGETSSPSRDRNRTETSQPDEAPRALSVTELDTAESSSSAESQRGEAASSRGSASSSSASGGTESRPSGDRNAIQAEGPVYTIQAVSFLKQSRAKREVRDLESQGYDASITEKVINGRTWYRVRVGSFSDRTEADDFAQKMMKNGDIEDYWISQVKD